MKLTNMFCRSVKPGQKAAKYFDGAGLFLYVKPDGKKFWHFSYRFAGKPKNISFGQYPEVGLREARDRREEARRLLRDNIDPSAQRRNERIESAVRAANTFEAVTREWFERHGARWTQRTQTTFIRRFEHNVFPLIGRRPINEVGAPELLRVIRKMESDGIAHSAVRTLSNCGHIFRYAVATGRVQRDIAADLRGAVYVPPVVHHPTITDERAVGELLLKIQGYGGFTVRCALMLMPYVFVRNNELTHMEWSEINVEKAEWRIPAAKMKRRHMHIVPLARQSLEILATMRQFSGQGQYVFPGIGRAKHLGPCTLVNALRHMGYKPNEFCVHGFRSMASTLLNEQGYNPDWIERQLAHKEPNSVRAAYNFAQYLPERRAMMEAWADYLDSLRDKARARQEKKRHGK